MVRESLYAASADQNRPAAKYALPSSARKPASSGLFSTARSARSIAVGRSLALSAIMARVARPTFSSALPPKPVFCCGAAQPARIEASAMADAAGPKRSGLDILLPLAFGLDGHGVEFGHGLEQLVERVGDDLLGRPAAHRAGEAQLEVAVRIEAKRKGSLALASRSDTRTRCAPRHGRGSRSRSSDDNDWCLVVRRLVNLGGFVEFLVRLVLAAESIGDFGVLVMHRRTHRSQPCRMDPRMLDNIVAESVMVAVASDFGGLGRFEAHVVPAEILEALAAHLAETLGPHSRA